MDAVILSAVQAITEAEFDALLQCVQFNKQKRIKRFRFFEDACNCLLGDILARVEICRVTGLTNRCLEFVVSAYGKPILLNAPFAHYNISHAGHYIACAIDNEPVGIDIERIRSVNWKVAKKIFTSNEIEYIHGGNQELRFFEVWTKKESRIKWEGKGLSKTLSAFDVFKSEEREKLFYHKIYQDNEVICHVCSRKNREPSVRVINIVELMDSIIDNPHFNY